MKALLVFYSTFWDARMLFIIFSLENSQMCHEIVKFLAAKATKIIIYYARQKVWKILDSEKTQFLFRHVGLHQHGNNNQ